MKTNVSCNKCDENFTYDPLREIYKCQCRTMTKIEWDNPLEEALEILSTNPQVSNK